jgi:Holliday junction DNA helicase RuvA
MIATLQGRVVSRGQQSLVIQVNGIGLRVFAPSHLLDSAPEGEPIALFTYLHVRESELTLYGCSSEEELRLFEQLISVSGVGPKAALALLSSMPAETLCLAIMREQSDVLERAPGIGRRTAEKIVFDLKDKVAVHEMPEGMAALTDADGEVIEALTALGYSVVEAQRSVQRLPRDVTDVGERLRLALQLLAKP